jgi:hypothetical protein
MWVGLTGGEGAKQWVNMLTELHNRGIRDACIVCCDGLRGLSEAIVATCPEAVGQTSPVHTRVDEMVSPVTAPPGQDLCRRVAFEALMQTCPSWWGRRAA